jgi:hypothetical protein
VLCVQRNMPAHIRWTNDLRDAAGNYLPHILRDSIDQTIHWANPAVSSALPHVSWLIKGVFPGGVTGGSYLQQ